jgi:cytochrome P450
MSAVTLDVIMGGIFGIPVDPPARSIERRLRDTIRRTLIASTHPLYGLVELRNARARDPRGILKAVLALIDRQLYAVIRERRAAGDTNRHDILSLLLQATDEDGHPMTDEELRDELITLVLAGHETTANSLAWTFERLTRHPEPYEKLRSLVRSGSEDASAYIEATVHEGMRVRPVIPMIVRMVKRPWQLGEYVLPAGTPVAVNIVAVHHRGDVYPDPHAFRPERFLGVRTDDAGDRHNGEARRLAAIKPGTYTWIPFGGGIRRCLGASLAMAEQKVVMEAVAGRVDLRAEHPAPERARQRNVTMIPRHGGRVVVTDKLAA